MLIWETENFTVESFETPHVSREDGGHIRIVHKARARDRTVLEPTQAIELMRLSMIVGEAMSLALNQRGIDIGRINYQDMGNWAVNLPAGPFLHIQVYGRAKSAKVQKWGDSVYLPHRRTGFYENFEPLNAEDVQEIKSEIARLFASEKYKDEKWRL